MKIIAAKEATLENIEAISKEVGGLDRCKQLGFIVEYEQSGMSLSLTGLGYLLYVKAGLLTSVAEAFVAGYRYAHGNRPDRPSDADDFLV